MEQEFGDDRENNPVFEGFNKFISETCDLGEYFYSVFWSMNSRGSSIYRNSQYLLEIDSPNKISIQTSPLQNSLKYPDNSENCNPVVFDFTFIDNSMPGRSELLRVSSPVFDGILLLKLEALCILKEDLAPGTEIIRTSISIPIHTLETPKLLTGNPLLHQIFYEKSYIARDNQEFSEHNCAAFPTDEEEIKQFIVEYYKLLHQLTDKIMYNLHLLKNLQSQSSLN